MRCLAAFGGSVNSITLDGDTIWVRSEYRYAGLMRSIPGGTWDRRARMWRWPATPRTAHLIQTMPVFVGWDFNGSSVKFLDLGERHRATIHAAMSKELDDLAPIPGEVDPPTWNHQRQCYWALRDLDAWALFLDMGTGKTRTAGELLRYRKANRILVLAPTEVLVDNPWAKAIAQFWPDGPTVTAWRKGSIAKRRDQIDGQLHTVDHLSGAAPQMILLNYEAVQGEMAKYLQSVEWDALILDESHKIKAPQGKRSKAIARIPARIRGALTGTPMPHSPLDIFAQYRAVAPDIFGKNWTRFRARYATMGGYLGRQVVGFNQQAELNEKVYSIAHRVSKDVLDLPPEHHIQRDVDLAPGTMRAYRELEKDMITWLDDGTEVSAAIALTKLLRLAQITDGGVSFGADTSKLSALAEDIESIGDEPIVVFTRFLDSIDAIAEAFPGCVSELSGRRKDLDEWKHGDTSILAVQIQSGGTGIDLTRARYCAYLSKGYSMGDYDQSKARVHRPGQERPVTYLHYVARGTVDEDIAAALKGKRNIVDFVLEQLRKR